MPTYRGWTILFFDFETNIKSEDDRITWLTETPAWTVKKTKSKDQELKEEQSIYNTFNLIPSIEAGYEEVDHIEYYYKTICYQAAQQVPSEAHRLYEKCSLFQVYELIMLNRAVNW